MSFEDYFGLERKELLDKKTKKDVKPYNGDTSPGIRYKGEQVAKKKKKGFFGKFKKILKKNSFSKTQKNENENDKNTKENLDNENNILLGPSVYHFSDKTALEERSIIRKSIL